MRMNPLTSDTFDCLTVWGMTSDTNRIGLRLGIQGVGGSMEPGSGSEVDPIGSKRSQDLGVSGA